MPIQPYFPVGTKENHKHLLIEKGDIIKFVKKKIYRDKMNKKDDYLEDELKELKEEIEDLKEDIDELEDELKDGKKS